MPNEQWCAARDGANACVADGRVRGASVSAHVRQSLLDDPVCAQLKARRECPDRSLEPEFNIKPASEALIGELLQLG